MRRSIITEGLHRGDGGELSLGQLKPGPHRVAQTLDRGSEEVVEKLAPLAENSPERLGHGEYELPVRHLDADDAGDPVAGLADFPLMAAWAKMPRPAGEGEEALMHAVGTLEPGEADGKVSATVELTHDGYGVDGGADRGRGGVVSRSRLRDRSSSDGRVATAARHGDGAGHSLRA